MKYMFVSILVAATLSTTSWADDATFVMRCNGLNVKVTHKVADDTKIGRVESDPVQFNINWDGAIRIDDKSKGHCELYIDANHIFVENSYGHTVTGSFSEIIAGGQYDHQYPPEQLARVTASPLIVSQAV